jgi:carbon monoxide dehydrogenase subunit G
MDLTGEYRIPAPRERVWQALNDPVVLETCIPGIETLEKTSDTEFEATVSAKVGPVKARFAGAVTLSNLDAPNGYTISGEGKGGAAGFAKGGADVALTDADDGGTVLIYKAQVQVGGKLAQIGSRLVAGTAKKMADDFFGRFAETVGGAAKPRAAAVAAAAEENEAQAGIRPAYWIAALVVVAIVLLVLVSR